MGSWWGKPVSNRWEDLRVPVDSVKVTATNPATEAAYKGGLVLSFAKAATNVVYFTCQVPHAYKVGTNIYPHVHYVPKTTGAGAIVWQLTYSWANINGTFAAETTLPVTTTGALTADKQHLTSFDPITGTGKGISSMLICSLSRLGADAADTYDDVAYLLEFDFHYLSDDTGSKNETSK